MYRRKINALMILFSLLGGAVGFLIGEAVLAWGEGQMPKVLLMGIYFGQFAFFVGLMCLLAEVISPELNGRGWRLRHASLGWKLFVPSTLVMLFAGAVLLQFIYGLNLGSHKAPTDILLAIDVSESMTKTDPGRESFKAAKNLILQMEPDKRAAVLTFNDKAQVLQPFTPVDTADAKNKVNGLLDASGAPTGGTNIGEALGESMRQIESAKGDNRGSMVILMSDGYSQVDLDQALEPYKKAQIAVNTIGMNTNDERGADLLKRIAVGTGGSFHRVDNVNSLSSVFGKIYKENLERHLVGERNGILASSGLYAALRILFVTVLGGLLGLSLGIIFDNRYLAKSFTVGGSIAGLLAGFILESGMKSAALSPVFVRGTADLILAIVLSLSTVLIAYKQTGGIAEGPAFARNRRTERESFGRNGEAGKRFK